MCFFKPPEIQMPTVQYVGPTQDEIDAQNKGLTDFQDTLTANNKIFQDNIQTQIDKSNTSTQTLLKTIADMKSKTAAVSGGGASSGSITSAPYAITTEDNVTDTDLTQTTQTIQDKKKPKGSLKITQSGIQSSAGTGVNYGV